MGSCVIYLGPVCFTLVHFFVGQSLYVVGLETSHHKNMGLGSGDDSRLVWVLLFFLFEGPPSFQTEPMHVVVDLFGSSFLFW